MNVIRRASATLGGIFLAVLLIAALAPKAARGVVAALVQVTNTSANPVPMVSVSPLVPYAASECVSTNLPADFCSIFPNHFLVPSSTPAGLPVKWLVIDEVAGSCNSFTTTSMTPFITMGFPQVNTNQNQVQPSFTFALTPTTPPGIPGTGTAGVFLSHVHIYAAANYFVYGGVGAQPGGNDAFCSLSFMGHLETN